MKKILSIIILLTAIIVIAFGLLNVLGLAFSGFGGGSSTESTNATYWGIAIIPFSIITLMGITQRRTWAVVTGAIQSIIILVVAIYHFLDSANNYSDSDYSVFWNTIIVLACSIVATIGAHHLSKQAIRNQANTEVNQ